LFRIANEKTTFADAFAMADDVLHSGVRGVTDLMVVPGLINLDFADIRSVMSEMGKAMMGTGEAEGDDRSRLAAEAAISNPLLDDVSMKGARGVLINITGGPDMTLFEVDEAANRIGEEVDADANIIFGSALDASLEGRIRVSVVATGIDIEANAQPRPVLRVLEERTPVQPVPPSAATSYAQPPLPGTAAPSTSHNLSSSNNGVASTLIDQPSEERADSFLTENSENDPQEEWANSAQLVEFPETSSTQDSFIPPRAVEPTKPTPEPMVTEPFRDADTLTAPLPAEEKKGPNLFQRMTSNGWTRKTDREEPNLMEKIQNSLPNKVVNNFQVTTEPAPSLISAEAPPIVEPVAQQPRLAGVDIQRPQATTQSEEDLLDIPAFLRRQAN
jgi:cell division protein FtsZ